MKSIISSLFLLFVSTTALKAQPGTADYAWGMLRYQDAVDLYYKVYKDDPENIAAISRLAQGCKLLRDYKEAERFYALWLEKDKIPSQSRALAYAQVLAHNGKYKESAVWYGIFSRLNPDDPRGQRFAEAYQDVSPYYKDSTNWSLYYLNINTEADEYSPMYFDTCLMFTSNRLKGTFMKDVNAMRREPFADLYLVKEPSAIGKIPAPAPNDTLRVALRGYKQDESLASSDNNSLSTFNNRFYIDGNLYTKKSLLVPKLNSIVNSNLHDGSSTYDPEGGYLYYTTSQTQRDSSYDMFQTNLQYLHTKIKIARYFDRKWEKFGELSFSRHFNVMHPALSRDKNVIFFVSDKAGGYGGLDIYCALRNDTGWSEPINMGPNINTPGNDAFPYADKNILYFASDGWGGLGGYDIFSVELVGVNATMQSKNLGYPVSSRFDDFGFILDGSNAGYFSSNRLGSDDIYWVENDVSDIKVQRQD